MRRRFSLIALRKNINLFKDIVNKSTQENLQTKSLQEFPRRLLLNEVNAINMKEIYNSQTKPMKIKVNECIKYNNDITAKELIIEKYREELKEIDDMIYRNRNKNRNVIRYTNRHIV